MFHLSIGLQAPEWVGVAADAGRRRCFDRLPADAIPGVVQS